MPIYTYRCTACGIEFDQHQHFSDPPLKKCPECGKSTLRKVITPAGIIFKGHGWYATDHRSPSGDVHMKKEKGNGSGEKKDAVPEAGTKDKASEAKSDSDSGTTKSK
jgi:putative FmdB family regulatory protein